MTDDRPTYVIYTDGSFRKPNCGAYAAIIFDDMDNEVILKNGEFDTTVNRMELMGVIIALEFLDNPADVLIYCDSQYVVFSMSKWLKMWHRHGYKNFKGEPIKNIDLMQRLHAQLEKHNVIAHWVRGHSNEFNNEKCDMIAGRITALMAEGKDWHNDRLLTRIEELSEYNNKMGRKNTK